MSNLCRELYIEIILTVLKETNCYLNTVIYYLSAVYMDECFEEDPEDLSYEQLNQISAVVIDRMTKLKINDSISAEKYINKISYILQNNLELNEEF